MRHTCCILERITLLEESEAAREEKAQQLIKRCVEQPFDLTRGPLLRVHLFQLEETEHVMVLTMHHIVSDAWSNAIFMRELTQLYAAFVKGESAEFAGTQHSICGLCGVAAAVDSGSCT